MNTAALILQPSAVSELLAEEFGLKYNEGVEASDEASESTDFELPVLTAEAGRRDGCECVVSFPPSLTSTNSL